MTIAAASILMAANVTLDEQTFTRMHMGVEVRITVRAAEPAAEAATAAYERINELELILSDWKKSSEVSRLNAQAGEGPVPVSEELFEVLDRSLQVARLTNGAFDPTVGPLTLLWREARSRGQLPDPAELASAADAVSYRFLLLDAEAQTAELVRPDVRLDLGGIAKGYIIDQALDELSKRGIEEALIAAGGDIATLGGPWTVQLPDGSTIELNGEAISTSGDQFQFIEVDGVRYSHIFDPRTGRALRDSRAVSVIAPNAFASDALATALSVTGPGDMRLLELYDARASFQ